MAQPNLIKDPATGAWFEQRGNSVVPWDGPNPDQIAQAQQNFGQAGTGQAFGMGIVNALGGNYWGPALGGVDPNQYQADMAAIQGAHPWAYAGGHLAAGVPLMAAAGPSIAGQAIAGAALGGLASSENPIEAALTGGAIGAGVGAVAGAIPSMAQRVSSRLMRSSLERDITAAVSEAPRPASTFDGLFQQGLADDLATGAANDITMGGVSFPASSPRWQMITEMADRQGIILTPGEKFNSMPLKQVEAGMESNPFTNSAVMRPIREANQATINRRVNEAMQSVFPEGTALTSNMAEVGPETVGAFRQQLGQNFNKIYNAAGNIPAQEIAQKMAPVMLTPEGMTYNADKILGTILSRTVNNEMTPQVLSDTRNFLSGMAYDLGRAPGSQMQANVYNSMVQALDNIVQERIGPEMAGQLTDTRQGWRLLLALEKGNQVVKENGNVMPGALYSAIRRGYRDESLGLAPLRAKSESQNKALGNLIETLRVTAANPRAVGDSGTATRMALNSFLQNPVTNSLQAVVGPAISKAYMQAGKSPLAQEMATRYFNANQARAGMGNF